MSEYVGTNPDFNSYRSPFCVHEFIIHIYENQVELSVRKITWRIQWFVFRCK